MRENSSLLVVLLVLCVASSNSISAKVIDVDVICKEASSPAYCSNLLNSKPRGAKGVDLVDLARYTIDVLNYNWSDTYNLIGKLAQSAENDTVANYYYRCDNDLLNTGGSVITRVGDAQEDLYYKRYPAMAKEAADIMKYILDCIDSLHKHQTSPLLAEYVENLRQGAQVFQIITKYLNLGK